jgi:1-acyl-sn-glycerol-3-phosphate acyltransferase
MALGVSAAVLIVLLGAPVRWFALNRRWRIGEGLPVLYNRALCAALGLRIREHGAATSKRPQLVVANHVSWMDIPVLASVRPTEFLAKKEVGAGPFVRALLKLQGVALVDRRRRTGIPAVNAEIARRMRDGAAVILFAEATTGDANRILRFRSSHFEAVRHTLEAGLPDHAVVQPIFLAYSRRAGLPVGRPERPAIAWYGDMTFLDHFWRVLTAGRIECDIYWGAPIPFFRDSNRKEIARRTEGVVRALARAARAEAPAGMSAIFARTETS